MLPIILFPLCLQAQLDLYIPDKIAITVNDSSLMNDRTWLDSLASLIPHHKLLHSIIGFNTDGNRVTTKIRLPQTLSKKQLVENIVVYYCLFDSDKKRVAEHLLVYPYFVPVDNKPFATCRYGGNGSFIIHINQWPVVRIPVEPDFIEKELYNQVLQEAFRESQNMDSIPDEIFSRVAQKNHLNPDSVVQIYQRVYLWHKSRDD